jgi:hypothetical protein
VRGFAFAGPNLGPASSSLNGLKGVRLRSSTVRTLGSLLVRRPISDEQHLPLPHPGAISAERFKASKAAQRAGIGHAKQRGDRAYNGLVGGP